MDAAASISIEAKLGNPSFLGISPGDTPFTFMQMRGNAIMYGVKMAGAHPDNPSFLMICFCDTLLAFQTLWLLPVRYHLPGQQNHREHHDFQLFQLFFFSDKGRLGTPLFWRSASVIPFLRSCGVFLLQKGITYL
jgi:hypothetical protein